MCFLVFSSSPWPRERLFFFFQQKAVRRVCKLETGLFMVLLRAPAPGRAESTSPSSHPREDLASPSYIGSGVPEAWKVCVGASHLFKEAGISLSALAYSGQREERRTEVAQGRVWRVFSLRGKIKKSADELASRSQPSLEMVPSMSSHKGSPTPQTDPRRASLPCLHVLPGEQSCQPFSALENGPVSGKTERVQEGCSSQEWHVGFWRGEETHQAH